MNTALILAGGTGNRLSAPVPKQYLSLGGKMIVTRCLERVCAHSGIDAVQIVAAPEWRERILSEWTNPGKFRGFSAPGVTRQLSILSGLEDIALYAEPDSVVLVHDAARPLVPEGLIARCLAAAAEHDGAMPVLPMTDTVYESADGLRVTNLLDRSRIFAGQAPEAFRLGKYLTANRRLLPDAILTINGATEPAVLAGLDVAMIPGDRRNFKITTEADLDRYRQVLTGGGDDEGVGTP